MADLIKEIREFGLTEFYMSLAVSDKIKMDEYSRYLACAPDKVISCTPDCDGCFMVSNGVQLLWATAAKALDKKDYPFAEKLLNYALNLADDDQDLAWIHANLAQICYHRHKLEPELGKKGINHCRELIRMGYMKSWAQNMMDEILLFQM